MDFESHVKYFTVETNVLACICIKTLCSNRCIYIIFIKLASMPSNLHNNTTFYYIFLYFADSILFCIKTKHSTCVPFNITALYYRISTLVGISIFTKKCIYIDSNSTYFHQTLLVFVHVCFFFFYL